MVPFKGVSMKEWQWLIIFYVTMACLWVVLQP